MTMKLPSHGELRGSERYDRPSMAWVRADEWQRRQWEREDRIFARMANQGQLCTPMVNVDQMPAVQSMVDGRIYDSKSEIRASYRAAGVVELGNDNPLTPPPPLKGDKKAREAAIVNAFKRTGIWDQLSD